MGGSFSADLSRRTGCRILLLDYKRCPEQSLPEIFADAIEAYRYLLQDVKVAASKIIISGESAGGALVIQTLIRIKQDQTLPMPAGAAPLSPFTVAVPRGTFEEDGAVMDMARSKCDFVVHPFSMGTTKNVCKGEGGTDLEQDGSELNPGMHLEDVEGFPPMYIYVGACEILKPSADMLVNKLRKGIGSETGTESGVTYSEFPNGIHMLHYFSPFVDEAVAANQELADWISGVLRKEKEERADDTEASAS